MSTMPITASAPTTECASTGIVVDMPSQAEGLGALDRFGQWLMAHGVGHKMQLRSGPAGRQAHVTLAHAPQLAREGLIPEILGRMLAGPVAFHFPDLAELHAHVLMRVGIVEAARRTELAFHTHEADRPADMWTETDEGFAIIKGVDLIDALKAATQPAHGGRRYAFSCYRASEYVMLIGMAEVIKAHNPQLYRRLQGRSERALIKSRLFHDTFLFEYGQDQDLPGDYYVPGDRVWFRNPDERSADLAGYEGSWTIYLGHGQFANFWHRDKPYTLVDKCVEVYHWRHGLRVQPDGELFMDEDAVAEHCARSRQDPAEMTTILSLMMRPRDASGTYLSGGCLDRTREYPRWVMPETCDMPV